MAYRFRLYHVLSALATPGASAAGSTGYALVRGGGANSTGYALVRKGTANRTGCALRRYGSTDNIVWALVRDASRGFVRDTASLDVTPDASYELARVSKVSAREADECLRKALHEWQRAEQSAVLWFGEIVRRKLYLDLGYASIHAYASEALGFSNNKTGRFLRLAADLERLPSVRQALAKGEIGWTKAREVVKVATPATEKRWVEAAKQSSRRDLEAKVMFAQRQKEAKRNGRLNPQQGRLDTSPQKSGSAPRSGVGAETATANGTLFAEVCAADIRPTEIDLADDSPAAIVLRLAPLQLARYDAMMERIRKTRAVAPSVTREEIHLMALEQFLECISGDRSGGPASGAAAHKADETSRRATADVGTRATAGANTRATGAEPGKAGNDSATSEAHGAIGAAAGKGAPAGVGAGSSDSKILASPATTVPRGRELSPYQIIVYKCEACKRGFLHTSRGTKEIDPAQLAAISCDAVTVRSGERNESSIRPSVRRKVLTRDRHRCQAPGCNSTRFLEVHHKIPREKGGTNRAENLITLCARCHQFMHNHGLGALPVSTT